MPEEYQSRRRDDGVIPAHDRARLQGVEQLPTRGLLETCARPKQTMQYVGASLVSDRIAESGPDAIRLLERCRPEGSGGTVSHHHVARLQIEQQPFEDLGFPVQRSRTKNVVESVREGVINHLTRNLGVGTRCAA